MNLMTHGLKLHSLHHICEDYSILGQLTDFDEFDDSWDSCICCII